MANRKLFFFFLLMRFEFLRSSMAFALITSLLNTIQFHFLQPLPCLIYDDREMVECLCKKLRFVQAFLEDSEENNKRVMETEIRSVAIDAEEKIESKLRQVYLCGNEDVERRLKAWSLHQTLQHVMREIESVERRIHQIGSQKNHFAEPQTTNTIEKVIEHSLEPIKNLMVGCDGEFDTIMNKLISHSKQLEVISIMGMGGIGKTTLVRRVYGDAKMISRFDIRAWATASQEYNFQKMVHELLECIVKKHNKRSVIADTDERDISDDPLAIGTDPDEPPESQLRKKLMGKRYLIVIDDIWGTEAWDDIRRCFPEEDLNGSRILLTTRLKHVADYVSSGNNNSHHKQFLNPNESWNLFYKKVFEDNKVSLEFESVGRHIVEKCEGLPLTIIVAAGLFTSINKSSLKQWRIVTENLNSLLRMDPEEKCSKVVSLSYYNLPPHLKVCFLYFGVFPEDSKIAVKKLIRLWVAEGFLKLELNKTMEDVAESYLQDLIDRGLVQIDNWSSHGKIKSCKLHDVLHSFCLREAQKESLLHVINNNVEVDKGIITSTSLINSKVCRWISNQLSDLEWPIAVSRYEATHTSIDFHSILYFPKDFVSICKPFPCFKLLRVLDIASTAVLEVIPRGIVDLVNLRYLALTTNSFVQDVKWCKLRSLQTFIVHGCGGADDASSSFRGSRSSPMDILDLPRLTHVHFARGFSLCLPKSVQENLGTISWLNLPHCMLAKPDFKRIPNVKKLGIYIETNPAVKRVMLPLGFLDGLVHLLQLDNLKIQVQEGNRPCREYDDFKLPVAFPSSLKKLTLHKTRLPWEDMTIISTLPNLEVLKLISRAFRGQEWNTTQNEFCKLKLLQIQESDIMHWRVDDVDHFPILEHLILSDCWNLEHIPDSFADITTLQLIEVSCFRSSLINSAKRIQEEQRDYGNDKLIVRDFTTRKLH